MTDLLLGIDIGTASSKGVLVTPDGEVVASATRRHTMSLPRAGHAEMDADTIWWDDVVSICRELAEPRSRDVAAVCVSGLGPCLLPTDAQLRPLRAAILYGIDSRATAEIDELTTRFGEDAILARAGKVLSSQAIGPKLLWLRRHQPDVWQRTKRWFGCSSYVVARLTGEYVLDHHTASQCDPFYDLQAQSWAEDWAAEVLGDLPLPRLVWPSEIVGEVSPAAAKLTGLRAGTPVAAGTVDAWAEAFSCGVRKPGDLMLMYGSTMFFVQVLDQLQTHRSLWTTMGVDRGVMTLAAGMATSGSLTEWVRALTGDASFEQLVAEAAQVPPGSDGLLLLPYFAGERTPILDPQARGVVAGMTLRHRRGHLYRAVYEGIAYGIRQILEVLETAGGPASRLVAVGGGTQGGLWTQIVSDVIGREQVLPDQTIGASYGDALLAAVGAGLVPADTDWATVSSTVVPDRGHAQTYDELYDIYTSLYPATRDQMHRLARIQEAGCD